MVKLELKNHTEIVLDTTIWTSQLEKTMTSMKCKIIDENEKNVGELLETARIHARDIESKLRIEEGKT